MTTVLLLTTIYCLVVGFMVQDVAYMTGDKYGCIVGIAGCFIGLSGVVFLVWQVI